MQLLSKSGKKLPKQLAYIRHDWAQGRPVKLMLKDEARVEDISDVCRC